MSAPAYDPAAPAGLTYFDQTAAFVDGADSPRAYLERCLETIEAREPVVKAFVALNVEGARAAADGSTRRWRAGRALSPIDGMPVGIKDLLETRDMPTEMGCAALAGNFPKRDNAAVRALREAGAVILGKTATAELGGSHPPATTNPWDPSRTPGGSSSGSAAAVAAGMVPVAIGTQVGGSIIRPAGYCGNFALKPSQGAVNRGERQTTSMSTHGPHAGCIEDMWLTAMEIASRVGGDPSRPRLAGPKASPPASKPERLIVLETAGWAGLDDASKAAFEGLLGRLSDAGVTLLRRKTSPEAAALEDAIADAADICVKITGWENRWYQRNMVEEHGGGLSARAMKTLEAAEAMTPADYETALARRAAAQAVHAAVGAQADAAITLACPGPAPIWAGDLPGQPLARRPTGDAIFNYPSSMLFAPVVTVPLLAVDGMPVGVQVVGRPGEDAAMAGLGRWLSEE